jgi:hypothetical protein
MCSEEKKDAHRFRDIILAAVEEGRVKLFKPFKPWSEKVAKQPRPKNPLAKKKNTSKAEGSDQQLIAQIRCSYSSVVPDYLYAWPTRRQTLIGLPKDCEIRQLAEIIA